MTTTTTTKDEVERVQVLCPVVSMPQLGAIVAHDDDLMRINTPLVVDVCGNGHFAVGVLMGQIESLALGIVLSVAIGRVSRDDVMTLARAAGEAMGVPMPIATYDDALKIVEEIAQSVAVAQEGAAAVMARRTAAEVLGAALGSALGGMVH